MRSPDGSVGAASSRWRDADELLGPGLALGPLLLALLCAVLGLEIGALLLLAASVLGEIALDRHPSGASALLERISLGVPLRFVLRVIVGLVAAVDRFDSDAALRAFLLVTTAYAVVLCARAWHGPPGSLATRNVPGDPTLSPTPPARVVEVAVTQLLVLGPALLGAPATSVVLLGVVAIAVLAVVTVPDARESWGLRRATGLTGPLRQVQAFLDEDRPEVVVHLGRTTSAAADLEPWLAPLEALGRPVLIVVRDPAVLAHVPPTTIPVLQVEAADQLRRLDLSSARVALFPSSSADDVDVLRIPHLMSALVGGTGPAAADDPFHRAYDELWVAGAAGADRYRSHELGVHEDQYRFVGRAQAHAISRDPRPGDEEVPTVLVVSAWTDDEASAHVVRGVETLLSADPPVRVVIRSAAERAAPAGVADLLAEASTATGIEHLVDPDDTVAESSNRATALVTDAADLVGDFLASEKPYVVMGEDGDDLTGLVDVVTGRVPDDGADDRAHRAAYVLGPREHRRLEAFTAAVDALVARSEAERGSHRSTPPPPSSDVGATGPADRVTE